MKKDIYWLRAYRRQRLLKVVEYLGGIVFILYVIRQVALSL